MAPLKDRLLLSALAAICVAVAVSIAAAFPPSQTPQADLYRVDVTGEADAEALKQAGVDPLLRVNGGYLVLVSPAQQKRLAVSGLNYHLIAAGVDRLHLAVDADHGQTSVGKYPVVFEEGGMRLYRVEPENLIAGRWPIGLAPIRTKSLPILFTPPPRFDKSISVSSDDLDSLLNRISEDSIIAYALHLESYDGRKVETYGNWASRTWLIDKFRAFGYDSVITDTFTAMGGDGNLITGHNVIAFKQGTLNPYHHVIIGAHYDTPDDFHGLGLSPGADDNGSGTVAVLEIARAFSGIETNQSLVFILFDAEEEGLLGSYAYARRATQNNDRIALMLNMDMIGYYENEHDAYLLQGNDSAFALVWKALADSIPGIDITGHNEPGVLASDDGPFYEYGWHTLAMHEYVFSTVYHSFRDSTTYLNFDYLTRIARATAATAYVVDRQFVPDYELWMAASQGFSEITRPNAPTPIDIFIREYGGAQLVPGSALIHYSINDSDFTTTPLISMGNDVYRGYLPPVPCLDRINYYVTADEDSLGTFYLPDQGSPVTSVSATGTVDIFLR